MGRGLNPAQTEKQSDLVMSIQPTHLPQMTVRNRNEQMKTSPKGNKRMDGNEKLVNSKLSECNWIKLGTVQTQV